VDAEVMLGRLKKTGFKVVEEIEGADVAIVNTCCFIREAEEESIDIILKLCQLKQEGKINKIIVCGCLPQRYKNELTDELKEVDAFVGVGGLDTHNSPREFLTPQHFAYVKISDGCNHHCSFCIIPRLRGRYRSRAMDSIVCEVAALFNKRGVKEINLIGQDTTMYGQDLYGQSQTARLLAKVSKKARGKWIRLLYAHPAHFSKEIITVIKNEPSVCKYIDLPIQHINDRILRKMRRRTSRKQIFSLLETLRKRIPHLAIRTTLIVGFPGETEVQFRELLRFIREARFERLGLFKYSKEKGSPAYSFAGQIPQKIKQSRYEQALSLQQDISAEINQGFLGKTLRVLIDEQDAQDKDIFVARSEYDAPEVDGCIYVHSKKNLEPGEFINVRITDTLEYDLVAEAIE